MGKISVCDKIVIGNLKKRKHGIKAILA